MLFKAKVQRQSSEVDEWLNGSMYVCVSGSNLIGFGTQKKKNTFQQFTSNWSKAKLVCGGIDTMPSGLDEYVVCLQTKLLVLLKGS